MESSRPMSVILVLLLTLGIPASVSAVIPMGLGGGLSVGGYFGDLSRDWNAGPGGTLFAQVPIGCCFEGRLSGSMQWSDGTLRMQDPDAEHPDLGAHEGDLSRSYRRTTLAAALIYRFDSKACRGFMVPYAGAGVGRYERAVTYDTTPAVGRHEVVGWDGGVQALAGIRFYRTSGLFFSLEAVVHGIDTPREWTAAYEGFLLAGVELGP